MFAMEILCVSTFSTLMLLWVFEWIGVREQPINVGGT